MPCCGLVSYHRLLGLWCTHVAMNPAPCFGSSQMEKALATIKAARLQDSTDLAELQEQATRYKHLQALPGLTLSQLHQAAFLQASHV